MKKVTEKMKKDMANLYKQGFGTDIIAKKLLIARTTVRYSLSGMGVKFRKAPNEVVSPSLHDKIVDLYKKDLPIKNIANKCNISFATVQRHLNKEDIKLKLRGNPIEIKNADYYKLTPEKAYILGVIGPGDGFIEYRKGRAGIYRIALEAIDLDFVKYFGSCLKRVYGIVPKVRKLKWRNGYSKPHYKVVLQSKRVCNDILSYNDLVNFKEKTWTIPKEIKNATNLIKAKYIQGFADSQGSVANYRTAKSVVLCSKNRKGLKEMETLLKSIGVIDVSVRDFGVFITAQRSIRIFAEKINFNAGRRRDRLRKLIDSYTFERTPPREIIKLKPAIIKLRSGGLSYPKIAEYLNISTTTVWRYSKDLVIENK